jgi:hypothetical protein
MQLIRSITAYYPAFYLGAEPQAIECQLSLVEANGRKYLKTPFAMLDAYGDDDPERHLRAPGYHKTEAECLAYLASEYPWSKQAEPIREALLSAVHNSGTLVGNGRIADKIDVSCVDNSLYLIARGHKRFTLRQVKQAVKALTADTANA